MRPIMKVQHVSVSIEREPAAVYAYAAEPANLPRWARGLAESEVRVDGDSLCVVSPMGEVRVRFVPRNAYCVLDHDVTLPSGEVVHNPMRVMPNGDGSEVVFAVFQRAGMDDAAFAADVAAVARDLATLRDVLEGR